MNNIKKTSFLITISLLFSGCQNLYQNNSSISRNLDSSLKPLIIDIVNTLYPFLAFIGLIILAISIYTLFIKPGNSQESPVGKLLMGVFEFTLAILFISAKSIVTSIFGS